MPEQSIADQYDDHKEKENIDEMEAHFITENDNSAKTEALERYYALNQDAKTIRKEMDELKLSILSMMKPNESHIGRNHTIFIKPGAKKFNGYNDPKDILEIIINSDIAVLDCITFNRKVINEFIKAKRLPTSISNKECFTTNASTLVFTKIIEK